MFTSPRSRPLSFSLHRGRPILILWITVGPFPLDRSQKEQARDTTGVEYSGNKRERTEQPFTVSCCVTCFSVLQGPFHAGEWRWFCPYLAIRAMGSMLKVKRKLVSETRELGCLCFNLSWHDSYLGVIQTKKETKWLDPQDQRGHS